MMEEQNLETSKIRHELKKNKIMVHVEVDEAQKFGMQLQNIQGCHERLWVNRDDLAKELEKDKHDRKKPSETWPRLDEFDEVEIYRPLEDPTPVIHTLDAMFVSCHLFDVFPTATNKIFLFKTIVCIVCIPLYLSYRTPKPWTQRRMNGDELIFQGPISQLETDQWIQNMEDHMQNNPIVGKDMTQHALQCFERGAATWWRMYQTINGWQGVTTCKEFKLTLL